MVWECDTCQAVKYETTPPIGLLQPLPVPQQAWTDISMDFIEGLPMSQGFNVILVVVDRFTKFGHFIHLSHPYAALVVLAQLFTYHEFKLHGLPRSIMSDRNPIFLSSFWKAFFETQGFALNHNSTYYPQSNGQTEASNKCLEGYLRCDVGMKSHKWAQWLPYA